MTAPVHFLVDSHTRSFECQNVSRKTSDVSAPVYHLLSPRREDGSVVRIFYSSASLSDFVTQYLLQIIISNSRKYDRHFNITSTLLNIPFYDSLSAMRARIILNRNLASRNRRNKKIKKKPTCTDNKRTTEDKTQASQTSLAYGCLVTGKSRSHRTYVLCSEPCKGMMSSRSCIRIVKSYLFAL